MIYIHRTQNPLSSNLAFATLFLLSLAPLAQYDAHLTPISMTKSSPPPAACGFTLIEFLVTIAAIGILLGIAVPSLNSAYERAKVTKDLSNLRQIGIAMQTYLNDKDYVLPVINADPGIGTNALPVIYPKYLATKKVFQSPFDKRANSETDGAPVSYGINQNIYDKIGGNMTRVVSPASTILIAPRYNGAPALVASWTSLAATAPFVVNLPVGGVGMMTTGPQRNGAQINALFCDLHAETMAFGPASTAGTFKDTTSNPLGLKHWDPTQ